MMIIMIMTLTDVAPTQSEQMIIIFFCFHMLVRQVDIYEFVQRLFERTFEAKERRWSWKSYTVRLFVFDRVGRAWWRTVAEWQNEGRVMLHICACLAFVAVATSAGSCRSNSSAGRISWIFSSLLHLRYLFLLHVKFSIRHDDSSYAVWMKWNFRCVQVRYKCVRRWD